jgi:PilZ domain
MVERRRSVRQNCRLRGRIFFHDGRKSQPCSIRDISYEGARIDLVNSVDLPAAIDLYIPQRHQTMHASVRWRHGNRIGVSFASVLRNVTFHPPDRAVLSGSISIVS